MVLCRHLTLRHGGSWIGFRARRSRCSGKEPDRSNDLRDLVHVVHTNISICTQPKIRSGINPVGTGIACHWTGRKSLILHVVRTHCLASHSGKAWHQPAFGSHSLALDVVGCSEMSVPRMR